LALDSTLTNAPLGFLQNILGRGTVLKEDKAVTLATACDSVTYCFDLVFIEEKLSSENNEGTCNNIINTKKKQYIKGSFFSFSFCFVLRSVLYLRE
jgi:hypothetical protein